MSKNKEILDLEKYHAQTLIEKGIPFFRKDEVIKLIDRKIESVKKIQEQLDMENNLSRENKIKERNEYFSKIEKHIYAYNKKVLDEFHNAGYFKLKARIKMAKKVWPFLKETDMSSFETTRIIEEGGLKKLNTVKWVANILLQTNGKYLSFTDCMNNDYGIEYVDEHYSYKRFYIYVVHSNNYHNILDYLNIAKEYYSMLPTEVIVEHLEMKVVRICEIDKCFKTESMDLF